MSWISYSDGRFSSVHRWPVVGVRRGEGLVDEFYVFASDHILDPEKRAHLAAELCVSNQCGQIHIDKIDRSLVKALSAVELLRETESEWLEVEPVTALMYMTFLAKKLAGSLPLDLG